MNEWDLPEPPKAQPRNDAPPVNRTITWLRVMLWLLPTGFAVLSAIGQNFLIRYGLVPINFGIYFLIVALFTVGTGYYNALLSPRAKTQPGGLLNRTVLFFVIQLFLVPLLLGGLLFAACLIDPIKF